MTLGSTVTALKPHLRLTSHAGMDSVRNMTGSPISGIDPHELLDVRDLSSGAVWSIKT